MRRNAWKKLAITVMAVGMMLAAGMPGKVYAAEDETGYEQLYREEVVADTTVERVAESPVVVYDNGDQSGYVDGTNEQVSWTYDAATKTITITGSGERAVVGWGSSSGFPVEAEKMLFNNCVISGSMDCFFRGMTNIKEIDLAGLTMNNVRDMKGMFNGCSSLTNLDVSNFDTSNVEYMDAMFMYCSSLTDLDVSNFDTLKVTSMYSMFEGCSSLTSLDVSNFDTSNVMNIGSMFSGCSSLASLDVSNFDTSNVKYMTYMFFGCSSLTSLDLSGFDLSGLTHEIMDYRTGEMVPYDPVSNMLYSCNGLETFITPSVMGDAVIELPATFTDGTVNLTSVDKNYQNVVLTRLPRVEKIFEDVADNQWYVPYIQYVYDNGLMNGTSATKFEPNKNLTREQFAVILYSYAGKPEVSIDNPFSDVPADTWYTKAVLWAYNEGIVSGIGGGKYGVGNDITREQLALMMYGYAKKCGKTTTINDGVLDSFADAGKVSSWANEAIQWALSQGVMSGKSATTLDPAGKATRAECATMVMRLAELQ